MKQDTAVKIQTVDVKDYLTKSNLPASDYVINPYIGCPHGCKYCYACFMKRFTNHREEWGSFLDVKKCLKPVSKKRLTGKRVFLSSVTDCYNRFEEKYRITRKILEQLIGIDCKVSISTKSSLILRDIDILKELTDLTAAISVNTLDESFRKDMDNADSIEDRLTALETLHENNISTVLFISPIFPHITDFRQIIQRTHTFTDEYWFEDLNLRGNYKKSVLDYINIKYPQYKDTYEQIYLKGDCGYWNRLSHEIEDYCAVNSIRYTIFFNHKKLVNNKKSVT